MACARYLRAWLGAWLRACACLSRSCSLGIGVSMPAIRRAPCARPSGSPGRLGAGARAGAGAGARVRVRVRVKIRVRAQPRLWPEPRPRVPRLTGSRRHAYTSGGVGVPPAYSVCMRAHLLRCAHNDCAVVGAERLGEVLHDRDVLVRRARRRVHQQVVELTPLDVGQELLDQAVLTRAAPDDGAVLVGQHEADGHDAELDVVVVRAQSLLRDVHGRPARGALVDGLAGEAEHVWYARATDVDVEQADAQALAREREGELRRHRALAHAALAREHQHLVLDVLEPLADSRDVGILLTALTRSTLLLVGAAVAAALLACALRCRPDALLVGLGGVDRRHPADALLARCRGAVSRGGTVTGDTKPT
eukprot:scaffold29466_cov57-Phaeocystis_antarctica.AAC.13